MQSAILQQEDTPSSVDTQSTIFSASAKVGPAEKSPKVKSEIIHTKPKEETADKDEEALVASDLGLLPVEPIIPSEALSTERAEPAIAQIIPVQPETPLPLPVEGSANESIGDTTLIEAEPVDEDIELTPELTAEPPAFPDFVETDLLDIDTSSKLDSDETAENMDGIYLDDDFAELMQTNSVDEIEDVSRIDVITEREDVITPDQPALSIEETEEGTLSVELEHHMEELSSDEREEAQLIIDELDRLIESVIPETSEMEVAVSEDELPQPNTVDIEEQAEQLVTQFFEILKIDYDEKGIKFIVEEMISDYSASIEASASQELSLPDADKGMREQKPGVLSIIYRYIKQKINVHLSLGGLVLRAVTPNPA